MSCAYASSNRIGNSLLLTAGYNLKHKAACVQGRRRDSHIANINRTKSCVYESQWTQAYALSGPMLAERMQAKVVRHLIGRSTMCL